jgi:hypothetical protein
MEINLHGAMALRTRHLPTTEATSDECESEHTWSALGTKPTKPPFADKGGFVTGFVFLHKRTVLKRLINIDNSLDTGHYFALPTLQSSVS